MASGLQFAVLLCLCGLWIGADATCNTDEYNFIRSLIHRVTGYHKSTWVGGHDAVREGVWLWSDGSTFAFTGWAYREPSNYKRIEHCMEINFAVYDFICDCE
ncbi:galactose-specific lectin nattectin-like [Pempheris klunzingeri]|uniref:galactose-specific lectin nattectin-like n=1 Tax=Pempheris klunzingeri TaxID=3127111 RepID=UPI00397F2FB2